jgi:hypothetical protein
MAFARRGYFAKFKLLRIRALRSELSICVERFFGRRTCSYAVQTGDNPSARSYPRLDELLSPDYCRLVPHAAAKTPAFLAACKEPCLRLLDTLLCDLSRVREILRIGPSVIGSGSDYTLSVSVTVPFSHSVASHTSGAIEGPRHLSPLVAVEDHIYRVSFIAANAASASGSHRHVAGIAKVRFDCK